MFIFFAYVSLALIQLYRRCQRRLQYSAAMLRALRSGSILVQRGKYAQHSSVGALLNSSLLSCSRSYKETLLLSDEHVAVSAVSPKQQVDLGDWTSYLDLPPPQPHSSSVVALLEAGLPESGHSGHQHIPLASRVQVLKHGCPLAWKSGNPFGVILHCSYEDFVVLCDALGQGHLFLNEDLQLHRMLTISTVGKPKSLQRPRSEDITSTVDKKDHLKTRRANTDPECLLSSVETKSLAPFPASLECGGDAGKAGGIDVDTSLTATPETDRSRVKPEEGLSAEVSVSSKVERTLVSAVFSNSSTASEETVVSGEHKTVDGVSEGTSEVTRNGSAVLVRETSVTLEESPVIQVSANGFEKNARVLSSKTSSEVSSVSSSIVDKSKSLDSQENEVTEVRFSSGVNDVANKNISPMPDVNSCEQDSEICVKDDSQSITDAEQQLTHRFAETEKTENMKVTENAVSALQTNAASPVSEHLKEDIKTDATTSVLSNDSQEDSNRSANITALSVNGSTSSVNGSLQNSEPPRTMTAAGDTAVNNLKSMSTSQGEKGQASPPESSANSVNGMHHTYGGPTSCKPPNVVVYCGKKDSARKFDIIKNGLEQCLNSSAYTIYLLPHEEVMTLPWEDNSAVLIISYDYLHDNIGKKFTSFLLNGGKVVSFGSSLEAEFLVRKEVKGRPGVAKFNLQKWRDVSAIQGRYHYVPGSLKRGNSSMDTLVVDPASAQPLVVQVTLSPENGNGQAIFSQLFLERDPSEMAADSKTFSRLQQNSQQRWEVLRYLLSLLDLDTSLAPSVTLTPCYLLVQDQTQRKSFLDSIASRVKQDVIRSRTLSLKFVSAKSGSSALMATSDTLPVVTDIPAGAFKGLQDAGSLQYFDPALYWRHLTTAVLGQVVMYTEIIPTTMTVFEGIQFSLPEDIGVIAVAGRQTNGKGRGGNQWLSPVGGAMFTLPLRLPVHSPLGQRISFLQHIAALAIVHCLRSLPGYENLDLRLKWPNDIYYGNKTKLGGVLVNSTVMGKTMHATIGCGINVSNSLPTVCINSIIHDYNRAHGTELKTLTTSEVLARSVSMLETLVALFQDRGHEDFCQLYYKYWLHSGARVNVESEGNAAVEIVGLDSFGFLRVVNQQGQHLSVQPDGNSFDMLRNLISVKRD